MQYSEEDINILRLIRTKGIGLKAFDYLNKSFSNITYALNHVKSIFKKEIISKEKILEELYSLHNQFKGQIITFKNQNYPLVLKNINDFPPVLSCIGNIKLLSQKNIAIVGSRNASLPFMQFTQKLSSNLTSYNNINIVSGIANGIDTYAHKGAIHSNKANTIVVLPHGIDHTIYPTSNIKLYQEIIKLNGLIISEFPLFTPPNITSFHQRNRIIAGLSLGTIIVQATKNSGSLMTARYAIDYNRQVFAVPGAPMSPLSEGVNNLINNGAQIIMSENDTSAIINNLTILQETDNKLFFNSNITPTNAMAPTILSSYKKDILQLLCHDTSVSIDTLASYLKLPISTIRISLVELYFEEKIIINNNDTCLLK